MLKVLIHYLTWKSERIHFWQACADILSCFIYVAKTGIHHLFQKSWQVMFRCLIAVCSLNLNKPNKELTKQTFPLWRVPEKTHFGCDLSILVFYLYLVLTDWLSDSNWEIVSWLFGDFPWKAQLDSTKGLKSDKNRCQLSSLFLLLRM